MLLYHGGSGGEAESYEIHTTIVQPSILKSLESKYLQKELLNLNLRISKDMYCNCTDIQFCD